MPEHPDESSNRDREEADVLLPRIYDELRRLAGSYLQGEQARHTLQPTALVHEAYLKVRDQSRVEWQNPAHLRAEAARAMRRILIDHARSRGSLKRGGEAVRVTLVDCDAPLNEFGEIDVLALDEALQRLAQLNERQAQVVELRFFGGLSVEEVARTLGISESSVMRDWRFARAWLSRVLSSEGGEMSAVEE